MSIKKNNSLPSGVSAVANRSGLYRIRCTVHGKSYSEYYHTDETGKKKLQSELQKAVDSFKERIEYGLLDSSSISDKSTFEEAVKWFLEIRKLNIRESTQIEDKFIFEHYLIPRIGKYKLKEITSPMITKLLAELLEKGGGGGRALYSAKPKFIEYMHETKPNRSKGGFNLIGREIGIGFDSTFIRIRQGKNCEKKIAEKVAKYYGYSLSSAFDKNIIEKPLSASYVSKISYNLSALFKACIRNNILFQNPVANATKPRIGEKDVPAYLDNNQIRIFLNELEKAEFDNSVKVALVLMLMLGLRSGEARGLRWCDIDYNNNIISIEKNAGDTFNGLALTELKTKRSRRKLPMSPMLKDILLKQQDYLKDYSANLGSAWHENGLVCPNLYGNLMDKALPSKAIKKITSTNKELPQNLHPHSLRHSFVSLLISNGIDVVNVASIAGDTIEIISKHYAHSFAERRASAMEFVGNSFEQLGKGANYIRIAE